MASALAAPWGAGLTHSGDVSHVYSSKHRWGVTFEGRFGSYGLLAHQWLDWAECRLPCRPLQRFHGLNRVLDGQSQPTSVSVNPEVQATFRDRQAQKAD